ncbi:MAG: hypothetical protein U0V73_02465 [Acidimicrobiia bacterium]
MDAEQPEREPAVPPAGARPTARRWIVLGVVAVVVAVIAVAAGAAWWRSGDSASRSVFPAPSGDVRARADLLRLLDQTDGKSWVIDFTFARRLTAGSSLAGRGREVNVPPDHLLASFGSLTGSYRGRTIDCAVTATGANCSPSSRPGATTTTAGPGVADRVRTLTGPLVGAYEVRRLPGRHIAGESARCFRLAARPAGRDRALGERTDYCLAHDGLPLLVETERTGSTDRQTARRVQRGAGVRDLDDLILHFADLATAPDGTSTTPSVPSAP